LGGTKSDETVFQECPHHFFLYHAWISYRQYCNHSRNTWDWIIAAFQGYPHATKIYCRLHCNRYHLPTYNIDNWCISVTPKEAQVQHYLNIVQHYLNIGQHYLKIVQHYLNIVQHYLNIEMSVSKHNHQWDHTENAYTVFSYLVRKYVSNHTERLPKFFLQTPCFATEKYDGTNICKDDEGMIFSRRYLIDPDQEEFIKTSLGKVKEADILKFKNRIMEVAGLDVNVISKCLVYGELMCNGFYDYRSRGIVGDWKVFGAILELKNGHNETLEKLLNSGFAAAKKNSNQIQVFANGRFVDVANYAKLDTAGTKGDSESIGNIIMKNKAKMKRGDIEGLILTIHDEEFGYKVVKWKGAHELQPASDQNALNAGELIESSDVDEDVKIAFRSIREVITDTSENTHVTKKATKHKLNMENTEQSKKVQNKKSSNPKRSKYLSNMDKTIIDHGVAHSQKKFDCVEEYMKKGILEEYKSIIIKEVRKHLAEEKGDFNGVDDEDNILAFITHKVNVTIRSQAAAIEDSKNTRTFRLTVN
jgi:hypothetical protein